MNVISYTVRKTTDAEHNSGMPYLTSSMIEAVNTCPRWGIVRNIQRRSFTSGFRQMALEAGSFMHDIFAAFNFWHLAQSHHDHAVYHAEQLFGKDRFEAINFTQYVNTDLDPLTALDQLAYVMSATSDFYDDPNDRNRTLANLEFAASQLAVYYLTNHLRFPILVTDDRDPTRPVGIEQSLDVVFECVLEDGEVVPIRFIGLADVVYRNRDTQRVTLGEYKTTSGMNDAWHEAFRTRHQITAYNGALAAYYSDGVSFNTILTGSAIPVRKTTSPVEHFTVSRDEESVKDFLTTALFTQDVISKYNNETVVDAPMFTHSCNRYFRPCSLLDFCTATSDDRRVMWENMEVETQLSPSEMKALLRNS